MSTYRSLLHKIDSSSLPLFFSISGRACHFAGTAFLRFPRLLPVVANLFIQLAGEAGGEVTLATKNPLASSPNAMPYITIPSPSPSSSPAGTTVALSPATISPLSLPCTTITGPAAAAVAAAAAAAAANTPTTTAAINRSAVLNPDPSLTAIHSAIPSSLAAMTTSSLAPGQRDANLGNMSAAAAIAMAPAKNTAAQIHSLQQQAVASAPQAAGAVAGVTWPKTSSATDASPFQDLEQLRFGRLNNATAARDVSFFSMCLCPFYFSAKKKQNRID